MAKENKVAAMVNPRARRSFFCRFWLMVSIVTYFFFVFASEGLVLAFFSFFGAASLFSAAAFALGPALRAFFAAEAFFAVTGDTLFTWASMNSIRAISALSPG